MMKAIPESRWKWFGSPGHFCAAWNCHFFMTTQVGDLLVSTVGEYHPYGREKGPEEIGADRLYETMVFKAGKPCDRKDCGCGLPALADASNIDFDGYMTRGEAVKGHMAMCRKVAAGKVAVAR